ncbi:hypothetical protein [Filimonas effusa]|uniref:Uncharacterized protein n=1 Tax=Filimonas effusa TaxID=2508721 RepID=A0A4Q1DDK7_9BACT|nr:hypothetical protein [Filimonas effusa]RXK87058.1 hypothetical protein ESB13_09810 [Filimonas effusa]
MYQQFSDNFYKLSTYITIIRQFKEDISEVEVKNEIKDVFGKRYCRVYINIKLKEGSDKEYDLNKSFSDHFRYEKEYFSFYLGSGSYRDDDDFRLYNREEEVHYNYIWNFLAWFIKNDNIQVVDRPFISEKTIRRQQIRQERECEERIKREDEAVQDLLPEEGQLIAIKQCSHSSIRIGLITQITLQSRKSSFSMTISEVKKDLSIGKVQINDVSKRKIYALIKKEKLPTKSKTDLIAKIESNKSFEGLIWRRPQGLWE